MSRSLRGTFELLRAVLVPMAANALVLLLTTFAGGQRHFVVNLDYFAIPFVHLALRKVVGNVAATAVAGLMLSILIAADAWGAINDHYFADPLMLFDLLPFVSVWPWRLLAPLAVAGVALGTVLVIAAAPAIPRASTLAPVALCILGVVAFGRAGPAFGLPPGTGASMSSSGTAEILRPAVNQFLNERAGNVRSPTPIFANSFAVAYSPAVELPPRILSVGVESWGISRDRGTLDGQVAILARGFGPDYSMSVGTHDFHGSTLEGEVRELCGLQLNGIPRDASERNGLRGCLPHALGARGYVTSGWHGNSRSFYRRSDVYPAIGLQRMYSYETLRPRVDTLCKFLFVGICDADVLRMAVGSFSSRDRAFVHVMTLDTHLPLPPPEGGCAPDKSTQLCSWEEGIDRTLGSVVRAVRGAQVKPDLIVIYGDHAPPFLDFHSRVRFQTRKVPFVVFWRQGGQKRSPVLAESNQSNASRALAPLVSQR